MTDEIEERYATAIQFWSEARGCVTLDMTPGQLERFSAWLRADCDTVMAQWIVKKRREYGQGGKP